MQTTKTQLGLLNQNDVIMAQTLGKINRMLLAPKTTKFRTMLDEALLDQLILHVLTAPVELLHSC
jgi:hypothetical protein